MVPCTKEMVDSMAVGDDAIIRIIEDSGITQDSLDMVYVSMRGLFKCIVKSVGDYDELSDAEKILANAVIVDDMVDMFVYSVGRFLRILTKNKTVWKNKHIVVALLREKQNEKKPDFVVVGSEGDPVRFTRDAVSKYTSDAKVIKEFEKVEAKFSSGRKVKDTGKDVGKVAGRMLRRAGL